MIDFAGGRGGQQTLDDGSIGNCEPKALVWAAGKYGATAGGRATYRPLGAFGDDGHSLAGSASGVAVWSGAVTEFLASLQ
jgi:hypothetical protein